MYSLIINVFCSFESPPYLETFDHGNDLYESALLLGRVVVAGRLK